MSDTERERLIARVDNILSTLPSIDASSIPKIFKVDPSLRRANEIAYEPQRVAIGPIHRGKERLKDMEQHKVMYLHQLLQRRGEQNAERYVVELMDLAARARKCYSNSIKLPEGDEFVEMLLLDGVFVIEYLRKRSFRDLRDENDYIFRSSQARNALKSDLVLLENQLPFMVLSQLFDMTKVQHPQDDLHYLLLNTIELDTSMPFQQDVEYTHHHSVVHSVDDHLLGLVYETYTSSKRTKSHNTSCLELEHTASELADAGVEFKTARETNLMDISFTDGVLQLPKLHVYDSNGIMLSNLVAYEQMNNKSPHIYMVDYIYLMTSLVKSAKDVEVLRHSGVIENWLENDEVVCILMNRLAKSIIVSAQRYFYSDIFQSLNNNYLRWHRSKWMAKSHLSTPWTIMSVIAAIILILLSAIQTIFTIIGQVRK